MIQSKTLNRWRIVMNAGQKVILITAKKERGKMGIIIKESSLPFTPPEHLRPGEDMKKSNAEAKVYEVKWEDGTSGKYSTSQLRCVDK